MAAGEPDFSRQAGRTEEATLMQALMIGRRRALQGLGGLGIAAAVWRPASAGTRVLRARSYSDLQVLDPIDWVS